MMMMQIMIMITIIIMMTPIIIMIMITLITIPIMIMMIIMSGVEFRKSPKWSQGTWELHTDTPNCIGDIFRTERTHTLAQEVCYYQVVIIRDALYC